MIVHDYNLTAGDKLLGFIRWVFKNHAEFRHDCLEPFARLSPLWGGGYAQNEKLSRIIKFSDGSQPIYLRSPIVLAAGANKKAANILAYANLGLGGATVGTATRHPREGTKHRPRVGLIEATRIIHNAMGLNNDGIEAISSRVGEQIGECKRNGFAVGISVAETPGVCEKERVEDIMDTFRIAHKTADYVEINVSCPNTGHNRLDQDTKFIDDVFGEIEKFKKDEHKKKAVYAKLSPDLSEERLLALLEIISKRGINGAVLGNTYPSKASDNIPALSDNGGSGGMSGGFLYPTTFRNTVLAKKHFPHLSIVSCGGVTHGLQVRELLTEGADFVQAYAVFAFRWMAGLKMNKEFLSNLLKEAV